MAGLERSGREDRRRREEDAGSGRRAQVTPPPQRSFGTLILSRGGEQHRGGRVHSPLKLTSANQRKALVVR